MPVSNLDILVASSFSQITPQVITGDGAITVPAYGNAIVALTKGSVAAITIIPAVATTDDGKMIWVYAETAYAHVITQSTQGFNGKGSSGTLTWAALKGNSALLVARNGVWWAIHLLGVTNA